MHLTPGWIRAARAALKQVLEVAFERLDDPDGYRAYLRRLRRLCRTSSRDKKVLELIARGHDL